MLLGSINSANPIRDPKDKVSNGEKLNNIASYPYPTQINVLITADLLTISRKKWQRRAKNITQKQPITLRLAKQYFWLLFFSS